MGDPQLALFLCTLLGESCRDLKTKLLEELLEGDVYPLYNMLDSRAKSQLGYVLPASTFLNCLLLRFCHDTLHFLFHSQLLNNEAIGSFTISLKFPHSMT